MSPFAQVLDVDLMEKFQKILPQRKNAPVRGDLDLRVVAWQILK